jgi:hypothetical protein
MDPNQPDVDKSQLGKWEYANYFEVGHNAFEFFFDFGQGAERVNVYTRIATNPLAAKRLFELLRAALEKYVRDFGPIAVSLDESGDRQ